MQKNILLRKVKWEVLSHDYPAEHEITINCEVAEKVQKFIFAANQQFPDYLEAYF